MKNKKLPVYNKLITTIRTDSIDTKQFCDNIQNFIPFEEINIGCELFNFDGFILGKFAIIPYINKIEIYTTEEAEQ